MKFKQIYRRMTLREKLLTAAFMWVLIIIAFSNLLEWTKNNRYEWSKSGILLAEQENLFNEKPEIDRNLEEILKRFNPQKTFGSAKLVEHVDDLARNLGLIFDFAGSPKTRPGETVELHSLRGQIKRKEIGQILKFEELVRNEFPYISIESLRINADRSDPKNLNATFVINSFELK